MVIFRLYFKVIFKPTDEKTNSFVCLSFKGSLHGEFPPRLKFQPGFPIIYLKNGVRDYIKKVSAWVETSHVIARKNFSLKK